MAIALATEYAYSNPPSEAYPGGSFKDDSTGATGDGTPLDSQWANDFLGFFQALLTRVGWAANGAPDTAQASQYFDAMEALMWKPGDYKWCAYSMQGRRWLECNGGTIGSAASGASARAHPDTELLFSVLWNEPAYIIRTSLGAASTRGASAAADFAANKRMVLPDWRGDALRAWDHGRGVDAGRALGTEQLDALQNITGGFTADGSAGTGSGAFVGGTIAGGTGAGGIGDGRPMTFDASQVVRTDTETRMRNGSAMLVIRY